MTAIQNPQRPAPGISGPPDRRSLLAIDGVDGSGKSVLAGRLVAALDHAGIAVVPLAVDDFRRPVNFLQDGRSEAEIYYDDYYDLALLDQCLNAFAQGVPSFDIPVFDSTAYRLNGHRTLSFGAAKIAVVEGVFALRLAVISRTATVIYVRTSFDAARERIVQRDTARGRTRADVDHRISARYFPAQERYLRAFDPSHRADVLIEHEALGTPRITRLDPARLGNTEADVVIRALHAYATPATLGVAASVRP